MDIEVLKIRFSEIGDNLISGNRALEIIMQEYNREYEFDNKNIKIYQVSFSKRASNALMMARTIDNKRVDNLGDIINCNINRLRHVGPKTILEIKNVLSEYGIKYSIPK